MPNHIQNKIVARDEVLDYLKGENSPVDFNSVIFCPISNYSERGIDSGSEKCAEALTLFKKSENSMLNNMRITSVLEADVTKLRDDQFEEFLHMIKNLRRSGCTSTLNFHREHWGTKWNAYQVQRGDGFVTFQTAWNHPDKIIEALSVIFPDDEIRVDYADEDIGSNLGSYTIKAGEVIDTKWIKNKNEFSIKMHYGQDATPADYAMNENWEYAT